MVSELMRRRMLMAESLPYDAEIEYLRATGTQYIDVGFKGDMDLDFSVTFKVDVDNVFYGVLGDRQATNSRRYTVLTAQANYVTDGAYITISSTNSQVTMPKTDYAGGVFKTYKKDGLNVYSDNTLRGTLPRTTFTTPNNITLFGIRNAGILTSMMHGEISACQFSKNGVLLRDFIPVRVGTTGYMYDKVSKQLFGNAGTGSFILGNDK